MDAGVSVKHFCLRIKVTKSVMSTVYSQLVPRSTRTHGQLVPRLSRTHGQLVPKSTRTQGQLVPKSTRTQVISYSRSTRTQVSSYPRSSRTQGQLVPKYNKMHKIHERVHCWTANSKAANSEIIAVELFKARCLPHITYMPVKPCHSSTLITYAG